MPILTSSGKQDATFTFARARGLAWVCDVAESTRALNDDSAVDSLERFLPKLYWTALQAVGAARGTFVKWTGDGFLAWFDLPLERSLGKRAADVFTAAWHLTFLVNVTKLGVGGAQKFRLRHAVAYEPDALVMTLEHPDGHVAPDYLGRSIVQAFRMSSIACPFPGIVTEARVAAAYRRTTGANITFRKRPLTGDERLRYFKGERFGTGSVYATANHRGRAKTDKALLRQAKKALQPREEGKSTPGVAEEFARRMSRGPGWARDVMAEDQRFVEQDLAGSLRKLMSVIERQAGRARDD